MKSSIKAFSRICDETRTKLGFFVKFNEEILNGKLHFSCNDWHTF